MAAVAVPNSQEGRLPLLHKKPLLDNHIEVIETELPAIETPKVVNLEDQFEPVIENLKLAPEFVSPLAWTGSDYKDDTKYTITLTETEIQEIKDGLTHFKSLCKWGDEISPETFPLPTLKSKLKELKDEIFEGRGFFVLRGLDPVQLCIEDNILIYIGVAKYIAGLIGKQDDGGHVLGHVRDAAESDVKDHLRPHRDSKLPLTFHTDGYAEVLGMQALNVGATGGQHLISSSWTIYNNLLRTHPEMLRLLLAPEWKFYHTNGWLEEGIPRPLFYLQSNRLITNFARYPLLGRSGVPISEAGSRTCTSAQVEVLDKLEALARENRLELDLKPGDMLFLNNLAIVHSREAFENDPEAGKVRHLVRLWMRNEEKAWELPKELKFGRDKVFYNEELEESWNITPQPRLRFKIFETLYP
ncbi:hypothetical protein N8I77_001442 [Diaporthe amygdali]|uniref:TauD/TfdA-like domain-containing protein n=1 Tax=Phomopsis amygdali TaxID=1214568 RepID=A0AAD9SP41_PHOAM|nr:hypothetical protein N8I77_001442 [Diaporthe amygdali]